MQTAPTKIMDSITVSPSAVAPRILAMRTETCVLSANFASGTTKTSVNQRVVVSIRKQTLTKAAPMKSYAALAAAARTCLTTRLDAARAIPAAGPVKVARMENAPADQHRAWVCMTICSKLESHTPSRLTEISNQVTLRGTYWLPATTVRHVAAAPAVAFQAKNAHAERLPAARARNVAQILQLEIRAVSRQAPMTRIVVNVDVHAA